MFTGLIEEIGKIRKIEKTQNGVVLEVECKKILDDITLGASISINGACHTVTDFNQTSFTTQTSNETIAVTNFSKLNVGDYVNLERAMKLNSRLDGHLVSGHIDGTATFVNASDDGFCQRMFFELDNQLAKYTIYKGSIAINGISLTIAEKNDNIIAVEVIPTTIQETNLKHLKTKDIVNIETDLIAKYIENFARVGNNNTTKITTEFLAENGFM